MPDQVIATDSLRLIPGRLRIGISGLKRNPVFAQMLVSQLGALAGIKSAAANPLTGRMLIYFDQSQLSLAHIQQEIDKIVQAFSGSSQKVPVVDSKMSSAKNGNVCPPNGTVYQAGKLHPRMQMINAVITGGILAGLILKRIFVGRSMLSSSQRVFNLAAVTTVISGYPLLRRGVGQLVNEKKVNHDLLIYLATLVLLAMRESITGLSVLWLVHISGLFNYAMQARAREEIRKMAEKDRTHVWRLMNGQTEKVALDDLAVGDIVVIHAGEPISVDGEVVQGEAVVDQTAVRGESRSCKKRAGDHIDAGALVETGVLHIRTTRIGSEESLARITALVEKAASGRDKLERSGEVVSGRLVPWTIGIAVAIFIITRDFERSLAVLLAGCPAAVAMSSQTALGMAVAQAAKRGIYIKDTHTIEAAGQADMVLFDKTGTLTEARPQVDGIMVMDDEYDEEDVIIAAASAEATASHPLARMFAAEAKRRDLTLLPATSELITGGGIRAVVAGKQVVIGNRKLMQREGIALAPARAKARRMEHLGASVVFVAVNGALAGIIGIKDTLHPDSREAIEELRAAGIEEIGLITGDNMYAAETVSAELGLSHSRGAMLPEDKAEYVGDLRRAGRCVIMVGDGINDSPAMATAHVGLALGAGASGLAIQSADIATVDNSPRQVPAVVEFSKKTMHILRQNLAFTVGVNAAGIALAAARLISPVTAALVQNISTLGVIFNSARLLREKRTGDEHSGNAVDLQRFADYTQETAPFMDGSTGTPLLPPDPNARSGAGWHSLEPGELCAKFETSAHFGLGENTVRTRLQEYGPNVLVEGKKPTFWQLFRKQFKDFMVKVLLGAAGLSLALGKAKDALLTLGILIANALLGAAQEKNAESSIGALQRLAAPMACVIRGGRTHKIRASELVPGDVIVLEAGDKIPADARLLTTSHFEVEEASLTGEPIPVKKDHSIAATDDLPLGDRSNMVFMGTSVTRGRAQAVVVATGMATEMGKIAALIQQHKEEKTPLQRRLEELGKYLVYGCLGISGLVMLTGLFRGENLLQMLQMAASLAVAAIPEGLSAIVVIALAMGVQRMARHNIIVRKMSSIETLGCATVICSDKTGTLTKNEMTVRSIYAGGKMWKVTGEGYAPHGKFIYKGVEADPAADGQMVQTLLAAALCNNARLIGRHKDKARRQVVAINDKRQPAWAIHGDPTEGALVVAAAKAGLTEDRLAQSHIRLQEIPFEAERRMMSVICAGLGGDKVLYAKGASDRILAKCTHYLSGDGVLPLDPDTREQLDRITEQMAGEALRVLAAAYRDVTDDDDLDGDADALESNLIFCGLVGMIDPPRPEVPAAIAKCKKAGVKVVMITGDHPDTARAIACELDLIDKGSLVVLGQELDRLSDKQLAGIVDRVGVFARTAPQHKLRIVKALKDKGYVVAMTGDGVNDASAVKSADIGIAMGIMGTDVTKEAAGMTLSDDNFATIVRAMEEGRSIYANIRKAIRYLLATNIGEVILMFLAALKGMPLPLLPIQLLWINLIGDGLPAIALVNDPPAKDIMQQKPASAKDSVFAGGLGRKVLTRGIIMGAVSLGFFVWVLALTGNLMLARTMVLAQVAISQFIHIFDCRLERRAGRVGLWSNVPLVGVVALSVLMVAGIIHIPALQPIFSTVAMSPAHWLQAIGAAAATAVLDVGVEAAAGRLLPEEAHSPAACVPAPMPSL